MIKREAFLVCVCVCVLWEWRCGSKANTVEDLSCTWEDYRVTHRE